MVEPLRHRQSKEAATDMFSLQPPRHISTLPCAGLYPERVATGELNLRRFSYRLILPARLD